MSQIWLPENNIVQPNRIAPIDWSNPLTRGLVMLVGMGGSQIVDSVTGTVFQPVGPAVDPWTIEAPGATRAWSGGTSFYAPRRTSWEPPNSLTWFAYARAAPTLNQYVRPFGKTYNNGASPYNTFDFEYNVTYLGTNYVACNLNSATSAAHASFYDTAIFSPHIVVATFGESYLSIYLNGTLKQVLSTSVTPGYDTSTTGNMIISGASSAFVNNGFKGGIYCVGVYDRALSAIEVAQLSKLV